MLLHMTCKGPSKSTGLPRRRKNIEVRRCRAMHSQSEESAESDLSFITLCSDIMDHDAELVLDNIREDSQASQNDEDYEYLTFQICEGEVMDNEMVNFIEIHMLNDGYLEGDEGSKNNDQEGGLNYQCQMTGAHFEFNDLFSRVGVL